jgi:hypothetical protein
MSSREREFDVDDPLALVPAVLGKPLDEDSHRQMAETFVEEYMLLGFPDEKIAELFHNPFFRATHEILRRKGESYVMELIKEIRNG